uniref:Uncharacterized protein n=1 Tax=Parascaris univalens TaxID=6257 RepID=A0A915AJQ0_PARUN
MLICYGSKTMGDASHGMMSRSVSTSVPRKNNSEEVAKRRAELQQKLNQRREEARRQQEQKLAKAAAQKEERLARQREVQRREMLRAKAVLDRRTQVLAEAEEKKAAVLAKAHATASRLNQQKARPAFAFGSSTPRELGYLTQLTKEQKVYDRKLQPSIPSHQSASSGGRMTTPTMATANIRTPSVMTRSLYLTQAELKARPKSVMTQSMVATPIGPATRANRSPVAPSNPAQRSIIQRRNKASIPSTTVRSMQAQKPQNLSATRKSAMSVGRAQKAVNNNPPLRFHMKASEQTKSTEGKTKMRTVAQAPRVAISNGPTDPENKAPDQETPKNAEEKKTVEIVHDSPNAENTDVNGAPIVEIEGAEREAVEMNNGSEGQIEAHLAEEKSRNVFSTGASQFPEDHVGAEVPDLEKREEPLQTENKVAYAQQEQIQHPAESDDKCAADQNVILNQKNVVEDSFRGLVEGVPPNEEFECEVAMQKQNEEGSGRANTTVIIQEKNTVESHPVLVEVPQFEHEPDVTNSEQMKRERLTKQNSPEDDAGREKPTDELHSATTSGSSNEQTTSTVQEGRFGEPDKDENDEERRLAQQRIRALELRAEQEQREREQRKARLAAIMSRTRGAPTAVVAPTTQSIITDESIVQEPLKDVERAPTPNDSSSTHVLSHAAASVLQKLASSNPRLLSVLQRNGSNPSLADELTAADPSMTLPGQPDEPSSRDGTATVPTIDFHPDVTQRTLATN